MQRTYTLCATLLLCVASLWACRQDGSGTAAKVDYDNFTARADGSIQAVIEIPAGTNLKIEYDKATKTFKPDTLNGKDRVIQFLPYPANYGFLPTTLMDKARGGDGDALDVLVLCPALPSGTLIDIVPIGVMYLRDRGELDSKIIAVPRDTSLRTISVEHYADFMMEYDAARRIIETWFLHYKGWRKTELIRWGDERDAQKEIDTWIKE